MKAELIEQLLNKHKDTASVKQFSKYCVAGFFNPKSPWFKQKNEQQMADLFMRVDSEGLVFDGKHITLQKTGLSYDYVAYKNKMLLVYPESMIDLQMVYKGDTFDFTKDSGKVKYRHSITNPFNQVDENIVGGYCVIKNKRGEFLTMLSSADIQKHRAVAKGDFIWNAWFKEMCMKTIFRKAVKYHFEDVFTAMNEADDQHNDLDKVQGEDPVDVMRDRVVNALEIYQGEDKEEIRNMCNEKSKSKEFTVQFAKSILEQMNPQNV